VLIFETKEKENIERQKNLDLREELEN